MGSEAEVDRQAEKALLDGDFDSLPFGEPSIDSGSLFAALEWHIKAQMARVGSGLRARLSPR